MGASPHILIIGGGVIGTAIACHLAVQGTKITLVEAKDLASGSSGACDGLVFLQSKKPGVHLQMAMESLKRFKKLQKQLPVPMEFIQTGGLVTIETDEEYRAMKTYVQDQQAIGLDVHLLDRKQVLQREPGLSRRIIGAAYSPLDAKINPINLTLGFALTAKKHHARILTRTPVTEILVKNNRVTGVVTSRGPIPADLVVNAAGAAAGIVSRMAGIQMPVMPRRGQIAVTHAGPPVLNHCLISAGYIAAKYNPELARKAGQGISMEQTENGNLLLGSSREFVGFDTGNTLGAIRKIITEAAARLPALASFQIIRTFAGLRPWTPDGLPILGPVSKLDGFVMAAGHEGDGIALSAITGELMADFLLNRKPAIRLDSFSPDRFDALSSDPMQQTGPETWRPTAQPASQERIR
ncbi:MAG: FAD-binding oxidoreductase [Desulfotignum sp.]|nr:FAD-binding oxidoreductase [Desulfotignum sp.]